MNKLTLTLILLFVISSNSFACLNGETKTLKNGFFVYEDDDDFIPNGHSFYVENYSKLILELQNLYKKTKDLDYLSDVGYVLTIQKKYKEALEIYFEIEKKEPNRYSTASNIGTIYELTGENIKALEWIKKAIKINSKSHKESEWLHIKILEAKINNQENINSTFLINADFGNDTIPKSNFTKTERLKLMNALYYQLNERVTFIKPKDNIIGKLLFELGNLAVLNNNNYEAIEIYKKAIEYGNTEKIIIPRIELANENIKSELWKENSNLNRRIYKQETENNYLKWIIGIITILLIIFAFLYMKRRKK
ncbi:tetratricopeptide repeat protein [Flavobacterium sp. SUN052]|uniref:tetratricopeptide repeat protein n=1 Tax=Flavobacterium sp. SUN052 TaxID=3002441 RepID=UPI00237EB3A2|nr:tetratricopeptide repeat protein [Flavobacterium sp. SUN052]MEC4005950.1 tetratricopeptide repeat protein [Flavobacterium sp. SUN052]